MRRTASLMVLLVLAASTATAQDPVKIRPSEYKVEHENDRVRVVRVKRGAHSKSPMHEHANPYVVIYITDVHQKVTGADGRVQEATRKAGQVGFSQPVKHEEENVADKPLEAILVELKYKTGSAQPLSLPLDPIKVAAKHHKIELENDLVRVIRSIRGPREKAAMHEHPDYVVVWLTDLHTGIQRPDGTVIDSVRKAGEVAWRDAWKHETENLTDRVAEEVQVELKAQARPAR